MHREQKQTYTCTQLAHNMHTHKHRQTYMQHTEQENTEQDIDTSTENAHRTHTEQDTEQHTCSAHNYRTYSLDYYHEFAYIKNSDTIELYTILQDKI